MLGVVAVIFLVLALADLVARINGDVKIEQPTCDLHDWWEIENNHGEALGLICIKCRKTPKTISREEQDCE